MSNRYQMFNAWWVVLALLFSGMTSVAEEVTSEAVRRETEVLVRRIKAAQSWTGAWTYIGHTTGFTALNVLALASAGVPEDDPVMAKGIAYLKRSFPSDSTYSVGLYAMAFEAVDRKKYWPEIKRAGDWLIRHQSRGTWNYEGTGPGDHSVSQFAMLGLKAAKDSKAPVPFSVLKDAERHFRAAQNGDGGWGYRAGVGAGSEATMTPAGLSSLFAAGVRPETSLEIEKGPAFIGQYLVDPVVHRGVEWVGKHLDEALKNPYAAYGVERVGIFFDQRYLGGTDWYRAGCHAIINGKMTRQKRFCPDQFQLLFLAKGNVPVLMSKARWSEDEHWNLRRGDARHFTRYVADQFQQKLDWQSVPLDVNDPNFAKAPILQISGHQRFELDEAGRAAIRAFVENGGTVLVTPNQGGVGFIRDLRKALDQIWHGARFEPLPSGHRLRGMYHDLYGRRLPLRVLKTGCSSYRVFVCDDDLSLAFEREQPDGLSGMLALNLARYALNEQPLVDRLAMRTLAALDGHDDEPILADAEGAAEGGLAIAQIVYDGDYNPDAKALANFQGYLRQAVAIPTAKQPVEVKLTEPQLRRHPVLYLTGHEALPFTGVDKAALRDYLDTGGFMVVDSCCSRPAFDEAFRLLVKELFPGDELMPVPMASPVYHEPFELKPDPTPALAKTFSDKAPWLHGLRLKERYVILYSPYDFGCAMDGHLDDDIAGFRAPSAYHVLTNLVNYGLSY